ncbi:MAG: GNAT family N-acetyltransferase [Granulosicoccus sp.]|nr:GNAT family N-acetyltransferase [Granulosicoccus sp.]
MLPSKKMTDCTHTITIAQGLDADHCDRAAELYDIAFGEKLSLAISNKRDRIRVISLGLMPEFAICALDGEKLIGLAGFTTANGSLTGGIDYERLLTELGWLKGNRAALVLSLYERDAKAGELLMDGITVDPDYRGQGIGTLMFQSLIELGRREHYNSIRLDVIDTNHRARRLYERLGFVVVKTERFEFMRRILGFGSATTMTYPL